MSKGASAMLRANGFDQTNQARENARHLPGEVYFSPAVAELEKEKIFMKSWLCVGRVEEVANPGDYLTLRIANEPVLIVRDTPSSIVALSNVCRHRGVEIARGQGNAKSFACPYHSWAYDLSGRLIAAPYMKKTNIDLSGCRLPPLKLDVWRGWMFINFDPEARALDGAIAPFEKEFGFFHSERCRLSDKVVFTLNCNWKFLIENFMDFYHVGTTHARSIGPLHRGDREQYTFNLFSNGASSFFFPAAPYTDTGRTLVGKMPWLDDKPEDFSARGFLAPNVNWAAGCDNIRMWVSWPLTPEQSQLVWYTLYPEERFNEPNFRDLANRYRDFLKVTVDEDQEMVESMQNGVKSCRFQPGPLSPLEDAIHHMLRNYLDELTT